MGLQTTPEHGVIVLDPSSMLPKEDAISVMIKSIKILIVDDDPDDAFLTTRCIKKGLEGVDLSIDHVRCCTELEAALAEKRYDLFLIDYHLGKSTGLEAMQRVKALGISSPMILLTGHGDEQIAVRAMKEGASDYLQKDTLSPEILRNTVRYVMDLFQAEARRKKSEKALRRNEEKYRTIINTTTEGYWLFDLNFKSVDLNASLCRLLGYTREEMLAKAPETLIDDSKQEAFQGALASMLSADQKVFETVLVTKNRHRVPAIVNATVIRSAKGKILQVFALVTDISKQKETETALKKANEALKKLDLMKSDFVSNVSHELRTPLTSIKNAIGILVKGKAGSFNETQVHFLEMAARNIDRLACLTNDVLDLSRIEARKFRIRPVKLRLEALLQNIGTLFQTQAAEKEIYLEADATIKLPPVYADPDRVEQVLSNLLSNALKFTPARGRVFLSTEINGEWLKITVSDNGPGLSKDDCAHVFERFYQVGDSMGQTIQGTGLGLPIAKELVEMQGGELSVHSEIGVGAQFFFTLPVYSNRAIEMVSFEKTIRQSKKDSVFSCIVVQFDGTAEFEKNEKGSACLNRFHGLIKKVLRMAPDVAILQPAHGRIICLLPQTAKTDAIRVRERLERAFAMEGNGNTPPPGDTPICLNPVTFPEDGETGKELILSARLDIAHTNERRENGQEKSTHRG